MFFIIQSHIYNTEPKYRNKIYSENSADSDQIALDASKAI